MKKKNYVYNKLNPIPRVRILEKRDLINGLRLNRNERVEDFPRHTLLKIFKNIPRYHLGKYPDQQDIYYYLSKFLRLKKNNLLLSSGIDGSLKTIFETMLKAKDKVAFIDPSYAMYNVFSNIYKVTAIKISYNRSFKLEKDKLIQAIKSGVKVLFLPNPNQPIEDNLSLKDLRKICEICKKNKTLFVVDEAYHMFGSQSAVSLLKEFDNLIVLRTFSKSFGLPSIRLGYIISVPKIINYLATYRLSYESNFLTDTVAVYFLKNINYIKNYIKKVIFGREFVRKELKKININVFGKKSNCLLVKFNSSNQYSKIIKALDDNKIYVKSGYSGMLANHILITCGPITHMKRFVRIVKKWR
jgi:histidinol-phosphate aminotransferase